MRRTPGGTLKDFPWVSDSETTQRGIFDWKITRGQHPDRGPLQRCLLALAKTTHLLKIKGSIHFLAQNPIVVRNFGIHQVISIIFHVLHPICWCFKFPYWLTIIINQQGVQKFQTLPTAGAAGFSSPFFSASSMMAIARRSSKELKIGISFPPDYYSKYYKPLISFFLNHWFTIFFSTYFTNLPDFFFPPQPPFEVRPTVCVFMFANTFDILPSQSPGGWKTRTSAGKKQPVLRWKQHEIHVVDL